MTHVLKFHLDEAGLGVVTLDGNELDCTGFSIKASGGKVAEIELSIMAEIDGRIEIDRLVSAPAEQKAESVE